MRDRRLQVPEVTEGPNPRLLGITAGPAEYATSIRHLLADAGIDALMVYYIDLYDGDPHAILEVISAVSEAQPKPVAACVLASDGDCPPRAVRACPTTCSSSPAPRFSPAQPNAANGSRSHSVNPRTTPTSTEPRREQ